jgi:hypothetical protein
MKLIGVVPVVVAGGLLLSACGGESNEKDVAMDQPSQVLDVPASSQEELPSTAVPSTVQNKIFRQLSDVEFLDSLADTNDLSEIGFRPEPVRVKAFQIDDEKTWSDARRLKPSSCLPLHALISAGSIPALGDATSQNGRLQQRVTSEVKDRAFFEQDITPALSADRAQAVTLEISDAAKECDSYSVETSTGSVLDGKPQSDYHSVVITGVDEKDGVVMVTSNVDLDMFSTDFPAAEDFRGVFQQRVLALFSPLSNGILVTRLSVIKAASTDDTLRLSTDDTLRLLTLHKQSEARAFEIAQQKP